MNERPKSRDNTGAEPWHVADERKPARGGAPIGTHSLTGGGAAVGQPQAPATRGDRDHGVPAIDKPQTEPDVLKEPRAGAGDLLGGTR